MHSLNYRKQLFKQQTQLRQILTSSKAAVPRYETLGLSKGDMKHFMLSQYVSLYINMQHFMLKKSIYKTLVESIYYILLTLSRYAIPFIYIAQYNNNSCNTLS